MKVKLNDVLEALDSVNDETQYFYNVKTEQIVMLMDGMDEEDNELREDIDENDEDYIVLPGKYEINEYAMMKEFIDDLNDACKQKILYSAIQNKGAFRRFKDRLIDLDLEKNWYQFRDEAHLKLAIRWSAENGIEIVRE